MRGRWACGADGSCGCLGGWTEGKFCWRHVKEAPPPCPLACWVSPRLVNTVATLAHLGCAPSPLIQVKEISRSLKKREAAVRQAEEVAAAHLQREKQLTASEAELLERESKLARAQADLSAARAEVDSLFGAQKEEARRIAAQAQDVERDRRQASSDLAEREDALTSRCVGLGGSTSLHVLLSCHVMACVCTPDSSSLDITLR